MKGSEQKTSADYPIDYGPEFLEKVRVMHASAVDLPAYESWIIDHMGGRVETFRRRLLPQIQAFTDLSGMDILDFGCGTGSTTVILAEASDGSVTAADIDESSLEMARMRFEHHDISQRVSLQKIEPIEKEGDLDLPAESFDFVLMNGVLEHVVPFRNRPAVLLEAWRVIRKGGMLFISETPNSLWPFDRHTTGLPLIPWLPSSLAHRYAVAFGRHAEGSDLDSRGRRGMTFGQIVRPLRKEGHGVEVLNVTRTCNRLRPAGTAEGITLSPRRRIANLVLEGTLGPLMSQLGIPTMALGPFIEYLCLKKH